MQPPYDDLATPADRAAAAIPDAYAEFWDCVEDNPRPAPAPADAPADAYQLFLECADAD
jgi:hypothetical protein